MQQDEIEYLSALLKDGLEEAGIDLSCTSETSDTPHSECFSSGKIINRTSCDLVTWLRECKSVERYLDNIFQHTRGLKCDSGRIASTQEESRISNP